MCSSRPHSKWHVTSFAVTEMRSVAVSFSGLERIMRPDAKVPRFEAHLTADEAPTFGRQAKLVVIAPQREEPRRSAVQLRAVNHHAGRDAYVTFGVEVERQSGKEI